MDLETQRSAKEMMLEMVPENGTSIGNISLRRQWTAEVQKKLKVQASEDDYWVIRNALISEGVLKRGVGKGGTVSRVRLASQSEVPPTNGYPDEASLYEPFKKTIEASFTKAYDIEDYACEITANQGKRNTGGKWTRPDVTLLAVRMYRFIPGKSLEVTTFEVKPAGNYGIEGVFETAAHSGFANRSFLAIHNPDDSRDEDALERIERECDRFGVGLIIFADPTDWATFDIRTEAQHKNPDPAETSNFIQTQIEPKSQTKIEKLTR